MADSPAFQAVTPATLPAGVRPSTEEVTSLNGGVVAAEHVQRMLLAIRTGDGVAVDLPADAANGLDVDVTRLPGTVAADLSSLAAEDFATQTTLAAVLAKLIASPATEATLAAVLSELGQKLEPGGEVALSAATLAALETIQVGNLPADPATQTTLAAILAAVDGLEVNTAGLATQATLASLLTDSQAKADLSETQPVSAASLPLPTGAATSANQATLIAKDFATEATQAATATKIGVVTESAPASDTASSGLNGRLQRIAQRLTSLIALLPASLGQKSKANSLAVTLASDQDALPITDNGSSVTVDGTVAATQSGTWTVQPGNTANSTAWKVDGSAVTQPVSGTVSVNALPAGTANIGDVDVLSLPALPAGTNNIGDVDVLTMPTVTTKHAGSTGAQTNVTSTVTENTTLIAADSNRFGLTIFNDSTAILFVLYGAGTESATVHSVQVAAGGYLEVPEAFVTMRASGHWASANGSARITAAT